MDEAHNLPDRARKIFSPELLEEELAGARRTGWPLQAGDLFADLAASVEEVLALLEAAAEELPDGDAIAETQAPADALHALRADWEPKLLRYLAWKREMRIALPDDPVMDAHFALHRFAAVLNMLGAGLHLRRRAPPRGHPPGAGLPRSGARARAGLPARPPRRSFFPPR